MNYKTIVNVVGVSGCAGSSAITEWLSGNSECFSFGEYEIPIFRGDGGLLELYQLIQTEDVFLCSFAVEKFILMKERIKCELLSNPGYSSLKGKYLSLLDYYKVSIDIDDALSKIWNEFLNALFIKIPVNHHIFGGFLKGAIGLNCKNSRYPNDSLKSIAINILIRLAEKLNGSYYLATEYNASQKSSYYFVKHSDKQELKKSINIFLNEFFNLFTRKRIVVCEQFVYPQTAITCDLLNNVKHIFVQRDLRDVFVLYVKRGWICDDDVESFILTSKMSNFMKKYNYRKMQKNVKLVRFEDFILEHEKETDALYKFINMSKKNAPSYCYNLEYSKSRIGLYKTYPNQKVINKIESELSDFIYHE